MCGRFLLDADYESLIERYRIFEDIQDLYDKKTEIFPSQKIWSIYRQDQNLVASQKSWGVMMNMRGKAKHVINGRSETLSERPFFQRMYPCIIPATGYFEWHQDTKEKHLISAQGKIIAFAGLYAPLQDEALIITKASTDILQDLHDRMPVILDAHQEMNWLSERILPDHSEVEHKLRIINMEPNPQLKFF